MRSPLRNRVCGKCENRFKALSKYSKICPTCKGHSCFSLAHCPKCNHLQISTAVSRFVCKKCKHSPLPKSVEVIYTATRMEDMVDRISQMDQWKFY
ncbi:MAG TPA: hypothetical protein VJC39_00595 [Candidatus Nanoarchaeia archaeon]|nr:hypothetical protein [Candidatus Nanoarchaeia archaeon]